MKDGRLMTQHVNGQTVGVWGWVACLWGLGVYFSLVIEAIVRLWPLAIEPLGDENMTLPLWGAYFGFILFNGYAEGYRGFQRAFVPRLVARVRVVAGEGRLGGRDEGENHETGPAGLGAKPGGRGQPKLHRGPSFTAPEFLFTA